MRSVFNLFLILEINSFFVPLKFRKNKYPEIAKKNGTAIRVIT